MRIITAKEHFLWYKCGQEIKENEYRDNWIKHVNIIETEEVKFPEIVKNNELLIEKKEVNVKKKRR